MTDRTGCCDKWPKPCSYHEGYKDAEDALTARAERAEADVESLRVFERSYVRAVVASAEGRERAEAREVALREALEAAAPEEHMVEDEQGGCSWCGATGKGLHDQVPTSKHYADCGWRIGREVLADPEAAGNAVLERLAMLNRENADFEQDVMSMLTERAALRRIVGLYAQHDDGCPAIGAETNECSCGLRDALAALDKAAKA